MSPERAAMLDGYIADCAANLGSATISHAGDLSLAYQGEKHTITNEDGSTFTAGGGRRTVSTFVGEDVLYMLVPLIEKGVLVIDYRACTFEDVARWAVRGPMMAERFESADGPDALVPYGSSLSRIGTREWCEQAAAACPGIMIHNVPEVK